jgi:hypothetical protein
MSKEEQKQLGLALYRAGKTEEAAHVWQYGALSNAEVSNYRAMVGMAPVSANGGASADAASYESIILDVCAKNGGDRTDGALLIRAGFTPAEAEKILIGRGWRAALRKVGAITERRIKTLAQLADGPR